MGVRSLGVAQLTSGFFWEDIDFLIDDVEARALMHTQHGRGISR